MRAFFTLLTGGVLSKLIGGLREIVFAALFGASEVASAYRVAFTTFTAPTHALVLETVSGGLVPLYKSWENSGEEKRQALLITAAALSTIVGVCISFVLIAFGQNCVDFLSPKAPLSLHRIASSMVSIMAIGVPFYVLGNLITFVETANGRYSGLSSRPALLNIASLIAAFGAFWLKSPILLAVGLTASHMLFLTWSVYIAKSEGTINFKIPRERSLYTESAVAFLKNSAPLLLIPLITQLNFVTERIIASLIEAKVIPCLEYARFISDTVLTLIAMPLGLIALAERSGITDRIEFHSHLCKTVNLLIILTFPAGVEVAIFAPEIVKLVFAHGAFDGQAATLTSAVLRGLSFGLGPTVSSYIMLRYLNARLRNRLALGIILAGVLANSTLDIFSWRAFGAISLGVGASLYGVICFVLCLFAFKIWRSSLPYMLMSAIIIIVNYAIFGALGATQPMFRLFLCCSCFLISIVSLFFFWKPFGSLSRPLLSPFLGKIRRIFNDT